MTRIDHHQVLHRIRGLDTNHSAPSAILRHVRHLLCLHFPRCPNDRAITALFMNDDVTAVLRVMDGHSRLRADIDPVELLIESQIALLTTSSIIQEFIRILGIIEPGYSYLADIADIEISMERLPHEEGMSAM